MNRLLKHTDPAPGKWRGAASALLLAASAATAQDAGPLSPSDFNLVSLGTLGGNTSFALDVNNQRQVSGNSPVTSDPGSTGSLLRAYLWSNGSMTNLGSMAPVPPNTSTNRFGRGYAVNDSGVVVGEFNNDSSRAFAYSAGAMSGLTRLAGDNHNGVASDINNAGVIVGSSSNGTASKPTKWTFDGNAYMASDLGTVAGTATSTGRAWAINEAGAVAGLSTNNAGTSQATLWNGSIITNLTSLGNGALFSQAYGLNENLEVVGSSSTGQTVGELIGTSSTTGITRAFRWQAGIITELPPANLYAPGNEGPTTNYHSVANDINDDGLVVGNSQRISGSPAVATLWQNGVAIDLNTMLPPGSGWVLTSAEGINDRGDIVGNGTFGGFSRAFLLERIAVNEMPSFVKGADPEHFGNNTGLKTYASWATQIKDGDVEAEQQLSFQINVLGGSSIFAVAPAVAANGTLSYTLSGIPGMASVEVRLTDDATAGGSALTTASQTFTVTSFSSGERSIIAGVHADAIAIIGEADALSLETMADFEGEEEVRLDPDEVIFNVEEATRTTVPSSPQFVFLGASGSDVWIAPQTQPAGEVLWPGISTEGLPAGMVDGDVTLHLESVSGPGSFHLYQFQSGTPIRLLSSTGTDYRSMTLSSGQHVHANWAFTAAGTYSLTFSASALVDGNPVTDLQTYTFIVGDVPAGMATNTTLATNPLITEIGNPVTLTATVTPSNALGYVEFLNGATLLGQKALNGGTATFNTSSLAIGTHPLTARFVPAWVYDFTGSTSPAASVTITEVGGIPFSIVGVASSYQPGQTLDAQVVGYTLQAGESFRWTLRMPPNRELYFATVEGQTYSRVVTPAVDGFELGVRVMSGNTAVAETPWVTVNVAHEGTRPAFTRTDAIGNPVFSGDNGIGFTVSGRELGAGESVQYTAFLSYLYDTVILSQEYASIQDTTVATFLQVAQQDNAGLIVNRTTTQSTTLVDIAVAAQIVSDGVVIAQSEPVWIELRPREIHVEGVQSVYRQGGTLQITADVHPERAADDFTYTWEFSKTGFPTVVWDEAQQASPALTKANLTMADHDGGRLTLKLYNHGVLVQSLTGTARPTIRVTDDLSGQFIHLNTLSGHYHQGGNINLSLLLDPAPLPEDQIVWEWKWPGSDTWQILPGANGTSHILVAEQALDGVQVRATLDFAAPDTTSVSSEVRTILVDDHGTPPRQQPSVAGVTSYTAGDQASLSTQLPENGATVLTSFLWERKATGAASFAALAGQTGSELPFTAALADDGAQYRVSILKPDGTVAYGPSAAVTLAVAPMIITVPDLAMELDGTDLRMTLKVPMGESYELQFSTTLTEGSWVRVGEPFTGAGEPVKLDLPKTGVRGFYRIAPIAAP